MNCKVCQNLSGKNPNLSFFRFPSDYDRCREWAERCDIVQIFDRYGPVKFYKSFRICSEHFDSKYIVFDGRKNKLLKSAVPKPKTKIKEINAVVRSTTEDTGLRVTQKLLENLCRFCAEENTELTDIFSRRGKTLELEEKIKVLPITVDGSDKLPLKMCNSCIVKISKFHDFVRNCVKADIRLKTILGTAGVSPVNNSVTTGAPVETQRKGLADDLKCHRNPAESVEKLQKSDFVKSKVFLFLQRGEMPPTDQLLKDEGERCSSQQHTLLHAADAGFSYISSKEDDLLTKSNDVFGKKIHISSEGNMTLDRYICNVCSKTFSAFEILESHWKAHSLQPDEHGRFICEICDKLYPNKYRLNEHNRVHTGDYPFKCAVCDKKFHKMALLKQHSIVHEPNKRFVCSVCNLRSSRKGNLIQHLRTHKVMTKESHELSPLSHLDSNNSNGFEIEKNLRTGSAGTETNEPEKDAKDNTTKHICGTCQAQFGNLDTLKQHFECHITALEQNFNKSCDDICVTPKRNTRSRKRACQKTYRCEECGVSFKRKDTLTKHVRIHTGERPFVCGSCGFAFKQRGDCLKHERNHQKTTEEDSENYS